MMRNGELLSLQGLLLVAKPQDSMHACRQFVRVNFKLWGHMA